MSPWQFFIGHRAEILEATATHLTLVLIAMAIAVLIAVPLGMVIVQRPTLRNIALGIASVFQTIPSHRRHRHPHRNRSARPLRSPPHPPKHLCRPDRHRPRGPPSRRSHGHDQHPNPLARPPTPSPSGDSSRYPHSHDHHHRCSHHRRRHRRRRPWHLHLPRRSHGQQRRDPRRRHPRRPASHRSRRPPGLARAPPESSLKSSPILLSVTSANSASLRYLSIPAFSLSLFFSS
jgi:hypothetical protein